MGKDKSKEARSANAGPVLETTKKKGKRKETATDLLGTGDPNAGASKAKKPKASTSHKPEGIAVPVDGKYPYLAHPRFWEDVPPITSAKKIYATIVHLRRCDPSECRPLVFLTAKELPIFEDRNEVQIDVAQSYGRDGVDSTVRLINAGKVKHWDGSLDDGSASMGRMMGDLLGSTWEASGDAQWAILPLTKDYEFPASLESSNNSGASGSKAHGKGKGKAKVREEAEESKVEKKVKVRAKDIDWDEIARSQSTSFSSSLDLTDTTTLASRLLETIFVSDPASAPRTYRYVIDVRADLNVMSPDPRNPGRTFLDGVTLTGDTYIRHPKQPMVETHILPRTSKGGWATAHPDIKEPDSLFLISELSAPYPCSASVMKAATCIPAIMIALDDYLLALEMRRKYSLDFVEPKELLQALTSPVRAGGAVERSYDRLEFLGDAILKLITTIDVYLSAEGKDFGHLLAVRQKINSNEELRAGVLKSGVVGYVRGGNVSFGKWKPEGWSVSEPEGKDGRKRKRVDDEGLQKLGDKAIADVAEALIGASFLSDHLSFGPVTRMLQFLSILLVNFNNWDELLARFKAKEPKTGKVKHAASNGTAGDWMTAFAPAKPPKRVMGYTYIGSNNSIVILDNELAVDDGYQFEKFKVLGEAVFDFLVVEDLYDALPKAGAEQLARLKSSRTSKKCQASLAIHLDLFSHLKESSLKDDSAIEGYIKAMRRARQQADSKRKDAAPNGKPWWEETDIGGYKSHKGALLTPMFGDLLQATLGSIFIDSGANLEEVRKLYAKQLKPFMDKYCGTA